MRPQLAVRSAWGAIKSESSLSTHNNAPSPTALFTAGDIVDEVNHIALHSVTPSRRPIFATILGTKQDTVRIALPEPFRR